MKKKSAAGKSAAEETIVNKELFAIFIVLLKVTIDSNLIYLAEFEKLSVVVED